MPWCLAILFYNHTHSRTKKRIFSSFFLFVSLSFLGAAFLFSCRVYAFSERAQNVIKWLAVKRTAKKWKKTNITARMNSTDCIILCVLCSFWQLVYDSWSNGIFQIWNFKESSTTDSGNSGNIQKTIVVSICPDIRAFSRLYGTVCHFYIKQKKMARLHLLWRSSVAFIRCVL